MITRKLIIVATALFWSTVSSGAEVRPTVAELTKSARSLFAYQCEMQRANQERMKSAEEKKAVQGAVDMACTCMPTEAELVTARLPPSAQMSLSEFAAHMEKALTHCAAESVRQTIPQVCRGDTRDGVPPEQKDEYCRCMEIGLTVLTDSEIAGAAATEQANFRAKSAALAQGKPAPAPTEDAISALSSGCKVRN